MTPQELKNSILQLAIQGRLVEQRPEEGTAEELYKQIIPKQHGLTSGKSELDLSSMDFDIPDSWSFVELNSLFDFVDYRGKTPHKIAQGVFLITASNIRKGYMDYTRKEYISDEEFSERQSRGITRKGDLLFTTEAPMGNAALCDLDVCSCGQRIITFQPFNDRTIVPALYMYFILSPQFQKQLSDNCTGTTAKGIKADKLKHFLIPLPPLAEQKRIVAKIEELMPYIDRYEKAWSRLEEFNKRFPTDMQKSILQLAIQGKLVPQRPEEGTGEALYRQIQAEKQSLIRSGKLKKEKPLPEITPDEIPFEISEQWRWVRLGEVLIIERGGSPRPIKNYITDNPDGVNWIKIGDTEKGGKYINHTQEKIIPEGLRKSRAVFKGDFLLSNSMSFGRPYILNIDGAIHDGWLVLRPIAEIFDKDYLYYVLSSPMVYYQFCSRVAGAVVNNLNSDKVALTIVPVPPLVEQKRIVAKLEELLPICDKVGEL